MRNTFQWRWLAVVASVGIVCLPDRAPAQRREHREAEHRGSIHYAVPSHAAMSISSQEEASGTTTTEVPLGQVTFLGRTALRA